MLLSRRSLLVLVAALAFAAVADADTRLLLPLNRAAYQTNEVIDLAVVRSAGSANGELTLALTGADGSRFTETFPATRAVEHLHLDGRFLRPGKYVVEVRSDGSTAKADLEIYSHLRKSSFRLINWGRAQGKDELIQGEDSFGYNLFYGNNGQADLSNLLRAGVDYMANCTMSGGHQMDLRMECDWSDPYVTRGGTARVVRRAMQDRTWGNVPGVHFYDEPGLTWHKHPQTGEFTPHMVPAQVRSFAAAFGVEPLPYEKIDPKNPEDVTRWRQWARWKLGIMDAAWKESQLGVRHVRPDYLSVTQSQYGWSAFTDGYYFNVVRSLPVTSGHGGYDDFGPAYFNPSYFLEMARARDLDKPNWYLPTWYGNTPDDRFRMEQYLSFQTGLQGMMSPPDLEPATNAAARQGIVESNHLMQKLGTIFTTMPPSRPPVAVLWSLSQAIHTQTLDRSKNYLHELPHGNDLALVYVAGKLLQQQFLPVLEEDVLEGTLAADHKAVILAGLDYLDPKVIAALEEFAAHKGLVLLTGDCTVTIKGSKKLTVVPKMPDQDKIDELSKAKKYDQLGPYTTAGKYIEGAIGLVKALAMELEIAGIKPPLTTALPTSSVTRHAQGDVEYLFVVNASYDGSRGEKNAIKAAAGTVSFADDGRPVYDAVVGGPVQGLKSASGRLPGAFRFGPGQMRVFARTPSLIGNVRVATPVVHRDLARAAEPIRLELAASVTDEDGKLISGSLPMQVEVIDSLGIARYELYRATKQGQLALTLPLAANDPAGTWTIRVRELLGNREKTTTFAYAPPPRLRSIAGATRRAVVWGNDAENVFRFARLHRQVTIVKGTAPYHAAAAERLVKVLDPWGVKCRIVEHTAAARARTITEEEAKTWVGIGFGKVKPGADNAPSHVGFAVEGHAILLGSLADNALIKYLQESKFLPYVPQAGTMPGPGRGMVAWQRDGIGHGQESVALIAHDAEGLSEAVGTFYEAVAGLEPLTRWAWGDRDELAPATKAPGLAPVAKVAWSLSLPDRVDAIGPSKDGLQVLTHDGSLTLVQGGKAGAVTDVPAAKMEALKKELTASLDTGAGAAAKQDRPDRMRKLSAATASKVAVAYWGGTLRVVDAAGKVQSEQLLPQDVTALAWHDGKLIAGLADGQVLALELPTPGK